MTRAELWTLIEQIGQAERAVAIAHWKLQELRDKLFSELDQKYPVGR